MTIEILRGGHRLTSHHRSYVRNGHTTKDEHMPKRHREYAKWTPERLANWARSVGPKTSALAEEIMRRRRHPEQGFRSCLGIIRLGKAVGNTRLEAACRRALHFHTCSYASIKSILDKQLEAQALEPELPLPSPAHENLRGGPYYS